MPITDYYVTTDAMGSVMAVLDESGNVLERRSYDAFGEATYMLPDGTVVPDSPTGVDIGFQGQLMDELTGMYQMGYRWYSPVLGRWVSRDPTGLKGGLNASAFVGNNPCRLIDPLGLWGSDAHREILKMLMKGTFGSGDFRCACCDTESGGTSFYDLMISTSDELDGPMGQRSENAYVHAMRSEGQTVEQARALYERFVRIGLESADVVIQKYKHKKCRCDDPNFCGELRMVIKDLGASYHAVSDSFSPMHENFPVWGGYRNGLVGFVFTGGALYALGAPGVILWSGAFAGGYAGSGAPGHGDLGQEGVQDFRDGLSEKGEFRSYFMLIGLEMDFSDRLRDLSKLCASR